MAEHPTVAGDPTQGPDNGDVRGLLGSVAKALASAPRSEHAREGIDDLESPQAFREFLESHDLGIAPPAKRAFIEAVTGEDWEDYKAQLARYTDQAYVDRVSPSS